MRCILRRRKRPIHAYYVMNVVMILIYLEKSTFTAFSGKYYGTTEESWDESLLQLLTCWKKNQYRLWTMQMHWPNGMFLCCGHLKKTFSQGSSHHKNWPLREPFLNQSSPWTWIRSCRRLGPIDAKEFPIFDVEWHFDAKSMKTFTFIHSSYKSPSYERSK